MRERVCVKERERERERENEKDKERERDGQVYACVRTCAVGFNFFRSAITN